MQQRQNILQKIKQPNDTTELLEVRKTQVFRKMREVAPLNIKRDYHERLANRDLENDKP